MQKELGTYAVESGQLLGKVAANASGSSSAYPAVAATPTSPLTGSKSGTGPQPRALQPPATTETPGPELPLGAGLFLASSSASHIDPSMRDDAIRFVDDAPGLFRDNAAFLLRQD